MSNQPKHLTVGSLEMRYYTPFTHQKLYRLLYWHSQIGNWPLKCWQKWSFHWSVKFRNGPECWIRCSCAATFPCIATLLLVIHCYDELCKIDLNVGWHKMSCCWKGRFRRYQNWNAIVPQLELEIYIFSFENLI